MQKYIIFLALALVLISCYGENKKNISTETTDFQIIKAPEFELIKANKQKGLLILFPCFSCDASSTLAEFKIDDISVKNGFSVLAMSFNQALFLSPIEKQKLADKLTNIIIEHNLAIENTFIGGFSSGGNVSLLISSFLITSESQIQPIGVFVVDSPVDLLGLYKTAEKNLKLNHSEPSVQESTWIIDYFEKKIGNPVNGISNYEKSSPYTYETENIENLKGLDKVKLRFYTEPDLEWWSFYAKNDYEDLNAFYIHKLVDKLKTEFRNKNIDLIITENQGYRANGERHPHSWSIVNENELFKWMTK